MEKGLNFKTQERQDAYFKAYDQSLELWPVPFTEQYVDTSFGKTHLLVSGDPLSPPLVLLHAASCSATIWYANVAALAAKYRIYAVDLITESSKSILTKKMESLDDCAKWLEQTFAGLGLTQFYLCGLSVGGWHAANYASRYPKKVKKLILISPIQTLAKIFPEFFFKIMWMGFRPTRKNIERYIGWGQAHESPLPDSIIEQFRISVTNVSSNATFPEMIKKTSLEKIEAETLIMLGEKEFAFDIQKAKRCAKGNFDKRQLVIVKNASHLISVSMPDLVNEKILEFLAL